MSPDYMGTLPADPQPDKSASNRSGNDHRDLVDEETNQRSDDRANTRSDHHHQCHLAKAGLGGIPGRYQMHASRKRSNVLHQPRQLSGVGGMQ